MSGNAAPPPPAFDLTRLDRFLRGRLPGLRGEPRIERIAGGQSNPTYFVTYDERRLVLRKKPDGPVLPSAHAVDREYRVLTALGETGVPVPRTILLHRRRGDHRHALLSDWSGSTAGRPDNAAPASSRRRRRAVYRSMAETLARLHAVDWAALGLGDFGRPAGYFTARSPAGPASGSFHGRASSRTSSG
ncbi:MAG: phosphotransferase [Geminicoccaceae bacterium]